MASSSLDPLPTALQHGLKAVAVCGLLSLTTTAILFSCLTYQLLTWYYKGQINNGANQLFVLIYNLLIADIQQAVAFSLTTTYVVHDKLQTNTPVCRANGWFVSVGDLASGVFILGIAIHTFLAVVKGRILTDRLFYTSLACAWIFIYMMAILTVALHPHVYSRAGAWCWIDKRYDKARLWLHYFWIFACMFGTVIIYALIYISISAKLSSRSTDNMHLTQTKRAARYMIIYPAIYVACTLPLAGGRMAAMTGIAIPYWYYCMAGAAITSCGWLDVFLYALTRRAFIFSKEAPSNSCVGLHAFGWYNGSELYGTTTTIEGPLTPVVDGSSSKRSTMTRSPTFIPLLRKNRRNSNEQYFTPPIEGVISTKTTVEVTRGPIPKYLTPSARSNRSDIDGNSEAS